MIFRRWEHGHSLGAGVLGGLLLAQHTWTIAVLAFAGGLVAGSFAHLLRGLGSRVLSFHSRTDPNKRIRQFYEARSPATLHIVPSLDVESMHAVTYPTGVAGVRVDAQGREWYSAAWIGNGAA